MNILGIIGDQLDPIEAKVNSVAAKGDEAIFLEIYEHDYRFSEAIEELNNLLPELSTTEININYFSLENWDNGVEGLIGDMWFNFVEFVKKVIRTIKTAIAHFIQGTRFRLNYFEDMRIKLRASNNFNILNFENTTTLAFSKTDFEEVLRALDILRRTLNSLFNKQDFDLDGIMEFRQYGIVFNRGAIVKDLGSGQKSSQFDLGFNQVAGKTLDRLGWNMSALVPMLDRLVEVVKYDLKKDYEYIRFQGAMDKLIRTKEHEAKRDYEEIHRLTNITKSMAAMVSYNASMTWKLTRQMVTMLKALEAPVKQARSENVY